jgi:hypothetical protein
MCNWDEDLVRQTFHHDDVHVILSISVHEDMEDVIGCHFDSKGLFSVKSTYKIQIDADSSRLGVSSTSSTHHSRAGGSFPWQNI